MSVRDAVFLVIGIMCGISFVIIMSCMIISGQESERERYEINRRK